MRSAYPIASRWRFPSPFSLSQPYSIPLHPLLHSSLRADYSAMFHSPRPRAYTCTCQTLGDGWRPSASSPRALKSCRGRSGTNPARTLLRAHETEACTSTRTIIRFEYESGPSAHRRRQRRRSSGGVGRQVLHCVFAAVKFLADCGPNKVRIRLGLLPAPNGLPVPPNHWRKVMSLPRHMSETY